MRKIFILLLLSQSLSSQITKNMGDFNQLKVFDQLNVQLIPADENVIEIQGDRAEEVQLVNNNGELKLRMGFKKLLKGEDITIKLYFKNLQYIDASEGSYIICDEPIKQTMLDLNTKEGGEIIMILDVERAKVRAVSGGKISISGTSSVLDATIGTGGILDAQKFETTQTAVSITTGGEAAVFATDVVDAKVRAGGTITIFGNPKQVNQKTILGGKIIQSNR